MTMTEFTIQTLWDGTLLREEEQILFSLSVECDKVTLEVQAPFYDDPKPLETAAGCMNFDGLWNFEVVELFIKGGHDKYLEIELGPHGHFLLLVCDGYRQCFHRGIDPIAYTARISGNRWKGVLEFSPELLPPMSAVPAAIYSFNAFGIHGKPEERVYAALFPPEKAEGEYLVPDFHRLELFHPFPSGLFPFPYSEKQSVWQSYLCD